MYSFYYNRILRSLTLICINPENPLPMIATSEIISTISLVLTPNTIKIVIAIITIIYLRNMSNTIIITYNNQRINNNKTESTLLLLLFMLFYLLYNDITLVQYI